jgi:hypothetical protein
MHLVIIGGKAAGKMSEILKANIDPLKVTIFPTIENFVEVSGVRSIDIDRFLLLQHGSSSDEGTEKQLRAFSDYIDKHYPASKLVCIVRDKSSLELFTNIFLSPLMVTVHTTKMQPLLLSKLVRLSPEEIKKQYPDLVMEAYGNSLDEEVYTSTESKEVQPVGVQPVTADQRKKKKGFLSLFGGKKPKKKTSIPAPEASALNPSGFTALNLDKPVPVEGSDAEEQESLDGSEKGNLGEHHSDTGWDEPFDDSQDLSLLGFPDSDEDQKNDMQFSWFGDGSTFPNSGAITGFQHTEYKDSAESSFDSANSILGDVGFEIPDAFKAKKYEGDGTEEHDTKGTFPEDEDPFARNEYVENEDETTQETETTFDSVRNFDISSEESESLTSEDVDISDNEVYDDEPYDGGAPNPDTLHHETGLGIHLEDESNLNTASEESFDYGNKQSHLTELRESVFSRGISLPTIHDIPALVRTEMPEIQAVEEEVIIFHGDLEKEYEDQTARVVEKVVNVPVERIVEKVIEVERIVEVQKVVNIGSNRPKYKNGVRTIIVTGDRKTGATKTAINMAAHYAKEHETLYVDFDLVRKGSLLYLGIEQVVSAEDHVQNGLFTLNNLNSLPNVVYYSSKGGFSCLLSSFGEEVKEEKLANVVSILAVQREYKTMIIDCPFENLHLLSDIILYSEVIACVTAEPSCALNTIIALSDIDVDTRVSTALANNSQYLLTRGSRDDFKQSMSYFQDLFSLDEGEEYDWTKLNLLGTMENFDKVLEAI